MPPITIPGAASAPELKAHLAVPPVGEGPRPGVVVLHEAFGLNDDIRQQADRLAAAGYVAVAPDLYSAGGAWRCIRSVFSALMAGEGKAFDDIEAARRYTASREDCTGKVGVIGFCQGGMWAFKAAGTGRFHRAVAFYGMIRTGSGRPEHADALDALQAPECCPVLAIIGGRDPYTPAADVAAIDALDHVEVVAYAEAEHGFVHDASRPSHRADDAADAWARTIRFLQAS